jgi:hypothetical protein
MKLNKKKSGIVTFARRRQQVPDIGKELRGVPVLKEYKYLGTLLTSKLLMKDQMDHINHKANFLFYKLFPYLKNATADGRRDMWQTMVMPLFNACFSLYHFEPSETHRENLQTLWRKTFKHFLIIPKCTPNDLVKEMINRELEELCTNNANTAQLKWEARLNFRGFQHNPAVKPENPMRAIPNDWCSYLKCRSTPCPKCPEKICTPKHLQYEHNLIVRSDRLIWKDLTEMSLSAKIKDKRGRVKKEARERLIPRLRNQVKPFLEKYREAIQSLRCQAD